MSQCGNCGAALSCPQCNSIEIRRLNQLTQSLVAQNNQKIIQKIITNRILKISIPIALSATFVFSQGGIKESISTIKEVIDWILSRSIRSNSLPDEIGPNRFISIKEFVVENPSNEIDFRVDVECQGCTDLSLTMLLLNEYDYQNFKGGYGYLPIHRSDKTLTFAFSGRLEKGLYHLVFYNTTNHSVTARIYHNLPSWI